MHLTLLSLIFYFVFTYSNCLYSAPQLKTEIENEQKLNTLKQTKNTLITQMNRSTSELKKLLIEKNELSRKIKTIEKELESSHVEMKKAEVKLEDAKTILFEKLKIIRKKGLSKKLEIFKNSKNYTHELKTREDLKFILKEDSALIESLRKNQEVFQFHQKTLVQQKNQLLFLKHSLDLASRELNLKERKQKSLLKKTSRSIALSGKKLDTMISTLDKSEEDNMNEDSEEPQTKFTGRNFEQFKGKLVFPTDGTIHKKFGKFFDSNLKNFIVNKGIEIKADEGTEIKTVFEGKIIFSGWFKGYGNMIIVDHGNNFYSISAHASKLLKKVGDEVKQNEPIATVGDSESLVGSSLYFELRHFHKPLDPTVWLSQK